MRIKKWNENLVNNIKLISNEIAKIEIKREHYYLLTPSERVEIAETMYENGIPYNYLKLVSRFTDEYKSEIKHPKSWLPYYRLKLNKKAYKQGEVKYEKD